MNLIIGAFPPYHTLLTLYASFSYLDKHGKESPTLDGDDDDEEQGE